MSLRITTINLSIFGNNWFPWTRGPIVGITFTSRIISGNNLFNIHGEWTSRVICDTTGPFDGSRGIRWITTSPDTEFDWHWGLWVPLRCGIKQSSHHGTIKRPSSLFHWPVNGIVMEHLSRCLHSVKFTSIISSDVSLREIVWLELSVVTS